MWNQPWLYHSGTITSMETTDICKVEFSYSRENELKLTIAARYA
jgi:hypothetical protein